MWISLGDDRNTRESVQFELVRISMVSDKHTVRVFGTKAHGALPELVAERRPDGKWYLSREWDAKGYENLTITPGDG
jgi:hypothetical protein